MRPQADVVEFVYECMSVTGEAMILVMISLNYFNAARIPGSAMLICMALVVLGNLGAQVGLVCVLHMRSRQVVHAHCCIQLQEVVLGRILLIAEPAHEKLIAHSTVYRHGIEAIEQYYFRWLFFGTQV